MEFQLRRCCQVDAVSAGVEFLLDSRRKNGLMIEPVAFGKSLVIANIVQRLDAPALIFQPSLEILKQNKAKFESYGYHPAVYSASANRKSVGQITLATIGSVAGTKKRESKAHLFQDFPYVIVDEADLVSAKGGQYKSFFDELGDVKILGMTATPWRMSADSFGTIAKFLTRTRPRIFQEVVHYTQVSHMVSAPDHWAKLEYHNVGGFDRHSVKANSTGMDFDDRSLQLHFFQIGFQDKIVKVVERLKARGRKNALIFCRFLREAQYVAEKVPGVALVTADTPKAEREAIGREFRAGRIWGVVNVGVFLCGFDYPELSSIVLARPTKSLRVFYQQSGRGVRVHPDKPECWIIDMCGLGDEFGRLEDITFYCENENLWAAWGRPGGADAEEVQLTNVYLNQSGSSRCKKCGASIGFWCRHVKTGNSAPIQKPIFGVKPNIALRSVDSKTFYEIVGTDSPDAQFISHYTVCGRQQT